MNTVMLWLLISLPGYNPSVSTANVPAVTVARFSDAKECERVRAIIHDFGKGQSLMCVQARVIP